MSAPTPAAIEASGAGEDARSVTMARAAICTRAIREAVVVGEPLCTQSPQLAELVEDCVRYVQEGMPEREADVELAVGLRDSAAGNLEQIFAMLSEGIPAGQSHAPRGPSSTDVGDPAPRHRPRVARRNGRRRGAAGGGGGGMRRSGPSLRSRP